MAEHIIRNHAAVLRQRCGAAEDVRSSPLRSLVSSSSSSSNHARQQQLSSRRTLALDFLARFDRRQRPLKRSLSDPALNDADETETTFDPTDDLRPVVLFPDAMQQQRPKRWWLIPAEHPAKMTWDVLTVVWSVLNAYVTHTSIRDRQFHNSFSLFCQVWFVMDILLNFVTEYKTGDGFLLKKPARVWARYLTTWFVIDVLSLFPGEYVYLQPLIDRQNKRNIFTKYFFRTKGVVRVTRVLRGRHFRLFGNVAKQTKRVGVGGARRLLHLLIKYLPKYFMFVRHMKAVVVMRVLRQVHWLRRLTLEAKIEDDEETLGTAEEWDDDGDPF